MKAKITFLVLVVIGLIGAFTVPSMLKHETTKDTTQVKIDTLQVDTNLVPLDTIK